MGMGGGAEGDREARSWPWCYILITLIMRLSRHYKIKMLGS